MTEATRTPLARLARWWWLLVSAIWIVGFALLLNWSPAYEIVYQVPIEQAPPADASVPGQPQMPYLADSEDGAPDARRGEVRAQMRGDAALAADRPDCWSDMYSAPDAKGSEMQWRCETRASWARMIATNILVLASFPIILPLIFFGGLRLARRITGARDD